MTDRRMRQGLKRRIFRVLFHNQTSYPRLSGDAFAALANLEVDIKLLRNLNLFNAKIREAQIVFCPSILVEEFIEKFPVDARLAILLIGNGDRNFTTNFSLDDRLTKYAFIQNSFISDGYRIFTMPIGIENKRLGLNGLIKFQQGTQNRKMGSILVGPFSQTAQSRSQFTSETFKMFPRFKFLAERVELADYSNFLHTHEYVLCPEGNGVDTHRIWEALYAGAKPVLLLNAWSKSLYEQGFPVVLTDSWEPSRIEISIQENSYKDLVPENIPQLWIPYWKKLFEELLGQ